MRTVRKSLLLFLAVVAPMVAASRSSRAQSSNDGQGATRTAAAKRASAAGDRIPADEDLVRLVDKALVTWPSNTPSRRFGGPVPRLSMPHAMIAYEEDSKEEGGALALELLVLPGAGSLYAHDTAGFVITWAGLATGLGLILYGLPVFLNGLPDQAEPPAPVDNRSLRASALLGGMAVMVGARVYGIVNAVNAVGRYNEDVRKSLGLMPTVSWTQSSRDNGSIDGVIPGVAGRF